MKPAVIVSSVNLDRFERLFGGGSTPVGISVPGRVNLIGEHTDYNEGLVLPVAIDRYVHVTARTSPDRSVSIFSAAFEELHCFNPDDMMNSSLTGWKRFAEGIIRTVLANTDEPAGMEILVENDLPVGGGLSSSAAFAAGLGVITAELNSIILLPFDFVLTLQEAEHIHAGVECGIMDQFSILLAYANNALLIDCRSLEVNHIPIPAEWSLVIMDTVVRRDLASSEYAERQQQCAKILDLFRNDGRKFNSLRDVSVSDLDCLEKITSGSDMLLRRCRHVLTENLRVTDAAAALRTSDEECIGKLFRESHISLGKDFEVTCPELDIMVEEAWCAPGCIASRMTGGGFGGCTVNFVKMGMTEEFIDSTLSGYRKKTGRNGTAMQVSSVNGIMSCEGKQR